MPRDAVVGSGVLVAVGLVLDCLLHIVVSGRGSSDCPRVVLLVVVLLTCYGATKHWLVTLLQLLRFLISDAKQRLHVVLVNIFVIVNHLLIIVIIIIIVFSIVSKVQLFIVILQVGK